MYPISFNSQAFFYSNQMMMGMQNGTMRPEGSSRAGETAESVAPGNKRQINGQGDYDTYECQTCKNRKYKDGSNDPGVSFKTATHLDPETASYAIRSHEGEHVAHARAKAEQEDQKIVSQSVTYHTSICPECGRTYMSGGVTRTVFRSAPETYEKEKVQKGRFLDAVA